ncbi:cytochrome b/b6 domain-containing protein [Mameliella sp. AT18]|uniref:cytochrome b/b6 domain-containing protein n=1 Tax=Mameliella sp. AT18 TaxID=3028385 RepID=UPI0008411230|nr:cytochrome b/b6 domain-containing protein [Mameliella sp. AT18]MDD9728758.1 cytochrome b/b6 domain-containing protein [Mameliella sp. AT18]ODM45681.1 cytochrome b [Ruegeria sp. PBVC088]
MTDHRIWDPFLRLFHWSLAILFLANAIFTDPDETLHEWVGYAIAALIALRLVWGLIGPRSARFASFMPSSNSIRAQLTDMAAARKSAHLGHSPLGALMIFNLIATLIGISATGYMMTTNVFWGIEWVEEMHEVLVTWAEISVVAHIAAVFWESRRSGINLPRAMLTGVKRVPDTVRLDP